MKTIYLTPGPSQLYFTAEEHILRGLRQGVGSISHRSAEFQGIYSHTVEQLRLLLDIPPEYAVVFLSSANAVWERLLQNCVQECSFHWVNGAFSHKFFSFAKQLGLSSLSHTVEWGEGFVFDDPTIGQAAELHAVAFNETSTGVQLPLDALLALRKRYPDTLLAVDATSSVPMLHVPVQETDSVYFSVQKGFGMPAGLGVWVLSPRAVERAAAKEKAGHSTGTYRRLPALVKQSAAAQTPETPNVLGIYLLGKICEDLNNKGIATVRRETDYKAALLYDALERHPLLEPAVREKPWRSKSVIVARIKSPALAAGRWVSCLESKGLAIGKGYGKQSDGFLRFANFPTHSKELFEFLVDCLNDVKEDTTLL
ncbi:MAG: aminotransferase class V-fold PLP-dependent enzyme [Bernardetiaceae bacterium]